MMPAGYLFSKDYGELVKVLREGRAVLCMVRASGGGDMVPALAELRPVHGNCRGYTEWFLVWSARDWHLDTMVEEGFLAECGLLALEWVLPAEMTRATVNG